MPAAGEKAPLAPRGGRARGTGGPGDGETERLPLRLSVARGALGVELTEPLALGPVSVEQLELSLVGVRYPLDLSRGVKQFHNRRAQLERAVLRLDFDALADWLTPHARGLWGDETIQLRLAPRGFGHFEEPGSEPSTPSVAVTLWTERGALAFDWVLGSGLEPEWIIDGARAEGLAPGTCALELAFAFVDRLAADLVALGLGAGRRGRALRMRDLSRLLCLRVLPEFGFRVPSVGAQVVERVEVSAGEVRLVLDSASEPLGVGRRGLRLAGLAELARRADEALGRGDRVEARRGYLEALELAPRHPELLASLVTLDLAEPGRAEAALSLLDEPRQEPEPWAALWASLESRALALTGRAEAARESAQRAAGSELDPLLAALRFTQLALGAEEARQPEWLERALGRSPSFRAARRLRFAWRARHGELRQALADAEHLDASAADAAERSRIAVEVAEELGAAGYRSESASWLKRALRQDPDNALVKLRLAQALHAGGELLRAIELVQSFDGRDDEWLREERDFSLALWLMEGNVDSSRALSLLRAIGSRSERGASARVLEGQWAARLGETAVRLRAHGRLLEAIEIGWIDIAGRVGDVVALARLELNAGERELARRAVSLASAVLLPSGQAVDSDEGVFKSLEEQLILLERALG
ncbi:MAG TPA: hypothetical protein VLC09_17995 [Polyangiaceae bacterium]|nr:hypothetical protein [Polyangiaceae bacterium]